MTTEIGVGLMTYRDLNEQIHDAIARGHRDFRLTRVFGQRYIGTALEAPVHFEIHGTPGNDMAAFMDGASIEVFGNAQDQVGNTMNDGRIIVHGRCGDATSYGMRGGSIYIRDDAGWRNGIHMKEYKEKCPNLIIGGNAGAFLGEYMAGGIILLLGRPGKHIASGMHGGVIYLAHPIEQDEVDEQLVLESLDDYDVQIVTKLLDNYNAYFKRNIRLNDEFCRLRPKSSRPYSAMYT